MIRHMKLKSTTSGPAARSARRMNFGFQNRAAGVLLHPTSLPGAFGCGAIGAEAIRFLDFLAAAGVRWWQMLPTNPPAELSGCPYSTDSSWAGNPLLISLDALIDEGLLTRRECVFETVDETRVDFRKAARHRDRVLRIVFRRFHESRAGERTAFAAFGRANTEWLDEYALFAALRAEQRGRVWYRWPLDIRARRPAALAAARERLAEEIEYFRFVQYLYAAQWFALRRAAHERGIGLVGDVPIFVGHDSCDVWANQSLFMLDAAGHATQVSGVPPDKFSRSGQVWNHPHYRWKRHAADGFAWWVARFAAALRSFDAVRIDHFLGFVRCWAIPGSAKTGVRGKWVRSPGRQLFSALRAAMGEVNIIAEDLGLLTPEAAALRDDFGFPGMRVLQWGFGTAGDSRYHQPHRAVPNSIVYPGTHDNDTVVGWFQKLDAATRERVLNYYAPAARAKSRATVRQSQTKAGETVHWDVIRMALASPANTTIVAMQDLLGLDSAARMNFPGTLRGNWQWRMRRGAATASLARRIRELTDSYERSEENR